MHRVDIHVLTLSGRESWLSELLSTLEDQPCNVMLLPGIKGETGRARAHAFRSGISDFAGYADDDDLVEPGSVQVLIDALDANPDAVGAYTDEILIGPDGGTIAHGLSTGRDWSRAGHLGNALLVHHLWIGRRALIERYLEDVSEMPVGSNWALTALMATHGPWVHVPMIGYRWRHHAEGVHLMADAKSMIEMAAKIKAHWDSLD